MTRLVATLRGRLSVEGNRSAEQDLREDGRERYAEERGIDVRCEGLVPEPRIQVHARDDEPDVQQVLSKQCEPKNEEQARYRCAADLGARLVVHETGAQGQQPGIDESGAHSANADIVGQQRISGGQDGDQAPEDLGRSIDQEAEDHECRCVQRHDEQHASIRDLPGSAA